MKRRDFLTYSLLTGGSSLLLPLVTACQKGNKISSSMPIEGGAKVEEMKLILWLLEEEWAVVQLR